MVDSMAVNAAKNKYLHDFLVNVEYEDAEPVISKFTEEAHWVMPKVMAYALLLERLVLAMKDDWKVLEACQDVWNDHYRISTILSEKIEKRKKRSAIAAFSLAKTYSIQVLISEALEALKNQRVSPTFGSPDLIINIWEAKALDIVHGHFPNAQVKILNERLMIMCINDR